jgi:hypothetical protein
VLKTLDALGVKLDMADVLEIAGEAAIYIGRPRISHSTAADLPLPYERRFQQVPWV